MIKPKFKGCYETPFTEVARLLPQEWILAGASNYTETDVDWDDYWGNDN